MEPDATSITTTAMTTAAIMTMTSSTMPTAVMTESRLKTMSSSMIWTITPPNDDGLAGLAHVLLALHAAVDLPGRLGQQEQATAEQDEVATRERHAQRSRTAAAVRLTTQLMPSSSRMRMPIAREQAHRAGTVALIRRQLVGQDAR